jgi:hypothetical protein
MRRKTNAVALVAALALAGCGTMDRLSDKLSGEGQSVTLTGANEVPPVNTSATGTGNVTVRADKTVKVDLKVSGMKPTAAHIHMGAPGANGGVIVPLEKKGDNEFVSKEGAKLTEEQYAAYKAGNTYVNVHSDAHKGGEIRAQLKGM